MDRKVIILLVASIFLSILSLVLNGLDNGFVAKCFRIDNRTIVTLEEKYSLKINGIPYGFNSKLRIVLNKSYKEITVEYKGKKLTVFCENFS